MQVREIRASNSNRDHLWTNGIVPYTFHESINSRDNAAIPCAMDAIASKTCIRFVPRTDEANYLIYKPGCSSPVGKKRSPGPQNVHLGDICPNIHEIGHALGVWHEQSRPDRDDYVRILWDNIKTKYQSNFQKFRHSLIDSFGTPYDYASVMHYPLTAFRKQPGLKTTEIVNQE